MSKRPAEEPAEAAGADGASTASGLEKRPKPGVEGEQAAPKLFSEAEVEAIVKQRLQQASPPVPTLLHETFRLNDPVHGFMLLPGITKKIVDTKYFQRMRSIRQLAMVQYVYPGATHNRFYHSIGTGYLAYEFMKGLRLRQPELKVTSRDIVCVLVAALCHDLGHPCYSHMFEVFMHSLGTNKRRAIEEEGRVPTSEEGENIRRYETWTHEAASVLLVDMLMDDLHETLVEAGMRTDAEGDDFTCVRELIEPPKKKLENALNMGSLREDWKDLVHGRPVDKAWMYEIVSNWRSGIDVDKFDYFRRDAKYLGIQRAFDHERYICSAKVLPDVSGVPTISTPEKDKDSLCSNMLELRKTLHMMAYQHKTVKKIELHMVDVLMMMDNHCRLNGSKGEKLKMSEAALNVDRVAYLKLTDTFVEAQLSTGADDLPGLLPAVAEYEKRVTERTLMRMIAIWDMPRIGEEYNAKAGLMPVPHREALLRGLLDVYRTKAHREHRPDQPLRTVEIGEFRHSSVEMHCGMGERDPITRVHFHGKDNRGSREMQSTDAKSLRRRVFVFWNPDAPADELTMKRLTFAFREWAFSEIQRHELTAKSMSPLHHKASTSPTPQRRTASTPIDTGKKPQEPGLLAATAPAKRSLRNLRIQSSCPPDP